MSDSTERLATAGLDATKTLFDRILEGNPNALPALMFLLMIAFLVATVFIVWAMFRHFKSEIEYHKKVASDTSVSLKETERNALAYRDKAQEKFELIVTKYHEDRQSTMLTIQGNLTSLRDTLAQLLGAVSRRDFSNN